MMLPCLKISSSILQGMDLVSEKYCQAAPVKFVCQGMPVHFSVTTDGEGSPSTCLEYTEPETTSLDASSL